MENKANQTNVIKVLSLEDSEADYGLIVACLRNSEFQFTCSHAINREAFEQQLSQHNFDIILSDFKLPGFDALAALDLCNKICPDVPFICVSGTIGEETAIHLIKRGAVDYVLKDRMGRLPHTMIRAIGEKKEQIARQLAEQAMQQSEMKYRNLFENSLNGIYRTTAAGKIIEANPAFARMFGYKNASEIMETIENIGEQLYKNKHDRIDILNILQQKGFFGPAEVEAVKRDGSSFWLLMAARVKYKPNGDIHWYEGTVVDITERKKVVQDLIESAVHFRNLADSGQALVWTSGIDKQCDYFNQPWLNFTGRSLKQEIGIGWTKGLHPDDYDHCMAVYNQAFDKREKFSMEYRIMHNSGSYKWIQDDGSPRFNSKGEFIGYIGHCLDITGRKQVENKLKLALEKAEESDRLKTAFLHNISHEIRTPMNAIIGFAGLITEREIENEKLRSFLQIIVENSNQLLNVVNDIINIASIEAHNTRLATESINAGKLFQSLKDTFSVKPLNDAVPLLFPNISEISDLWFESDRIKLVEVLSNLIGNALKFTKAGKVEVFLEVKESVLLFSVKDTGIGIDPLYHEQIFERFRQVENDDKRYYGGSGLGLSIAKAYVEKMGGTIWLESALNQGSVFYFTIPYKSNSKLNPVANSLNWDKSTPLNKSKTVLIAEDEDFNFQLLEEVLASRNIHTLRARNGIEAIEMYKTNKSIDLILMDLKMPVLDGFNAVEQIRKLNTTIPIFAQTAYAAEEDIERALAVGCNNCLIKPIHMDDLFKVLEEYL